jgi:hypothetical protein
MLIVSLVSRKESQMSNVERTKASVEGAWKLKSFHSKFADGTEYDLLPIEQL